MKRSIDVGGQRNLFLRYTVFTRPFAASWSQIEPNPLFIWPQGKEKVMKQGGWELE